MCILSIYSLVIEPFPKPLKTARGLEQGIEKTRETLYVGITKQATQGDSCYEDYNRNHRRSTRASKHNFNSEYEIQHRASNQGENPVKL
jgi:hypothetical protein